MSADQSDELQNMGNRRALRRELPDNPCAKEAKISSACLVRAEGDRAQCQLEFQNYALCRSFWDQVVKERRTKVMTVSLCWFGAVAWLATIVSMHPLEV
uniref:Coiled-coil-helix-coiled-coil-helix domain-containing protein 7 n=1 Tax=Trichuris muris TaxID=70415 RepID=A0A5S6QIG2_TRIMR